MAQEPWLALPTLRRHVAAQPELVRRVLQGVIGQSRGEAAGHRFERVERLSNSEALIRFRLRILGRETETLERVIATGDGVRFELVEGYLPAVEEEMRVDAAGDGSLISYSGRFRPRPGRLGRIIGVPLVRLIYRREVSRSLTAAKDLAEARQARGAPA